MTKPSKQAGPLSRSHRGEASRLRVPTAEARGGRRIGARPQRSGRPRRAGRERGRPSAEVGGRRSWTFANPADEFLHRALKELVSDIESFAKSDAPVVGRRLAWSEWVEELTITRHRERWGEARLAILRADGTTASTLYGTTPLELKPQMGLVPLGVNPQSKLWEFYQLRSAWNPDARPDPEDLEIPGYDANGRIDMEGRGIVFVLIPGGKFLMGAQSRDESAPNFAAKAAPAESSMWGERLRFGAVGALGVGRLEGDLAESEFGIGQP